MYLKLGCNEIKISQLRSNYSKDISSYIRMKVQDSSGEMWTIGGQLSLFILVICLVEVCY